MQQKLYLYNSLTRKKELFEPLNPPHVGMYVCGPTVYGDPHLGHARPAITFDLAFRYLTHLGYKVRYVRNITDVGHLEGDADAGEDKIGKKARLEELEPMEIVQYYTNRYHEAMRRLNMLDPSIEPHASGHIIEQIAMVKKILDAGFAYERNGSIYFDIEKYNAKHRYGVLSGRNVDELLAFTRELGGTEEKKSSFDFALWKKASPDHLMRWPSPWSEGYPGWHLECSTMGTKYLGETFDIHGGGMDLLFPHHECEIAQSMAANGKPPVRYWLHNNMITINGQKMGKSLGNAVSLEDFFTGNHPLLEKAYSPMTIRFFMLQAQYRSTLDFSNEALQASEKGMERLMKVWHGLHGKNTSPLLGGGWEGGHGLYGLHGKNTSPLLREGWEGGQKVKELIVKSYEAMNDDLNSPVMIAQLFEGARLFNLHKDGKEVLSGDDLQALYSLFKVMLFDILGLKDEEAGTDNSGLTEGLMATLIGLRNEAREKKDFAASDKIRDELKKLGVVLKDTKEGTEWSIE